MSKRRVSYKPLQRPNEIRLLQLCPADNDRKAALPRTKLIHTTINSDLSFSALSYVWGTEKDEELLHCDGARVRTTRNLGQALRHLQQHDEPLHLWVDSLCINQGDILERNQQVQMMGDIYGTANQVLIWLGPDKQRISEGIFDIISVTIGKLIEAIESGIEPEMTERWLPREEAEGRLKTVAPLFRCEWFTRTWTVQEAGLTTNPVAVWGGARLDFGLIGLFCMAYAKYFGSVVQSQQLRAEIETLVDLFTIYLPSPGAKRLHQVLHQGRRFLATDSRDKIYAFMSHPAALERASDYPYHAFHEDESSVISEDAVRKRNLAFILSPGGPLDNNDTLTARLAATDLNHPPRPPSPDAASARSVLHWPVRHNVHHLARYRPGQRSFITPNYNHSAPTVYRDFATAMISRTESLEVLSFVFHPSDPPTTGPDFPSWVPRWDIATSMAPLGLATSDHFAAANRRPIITPSSDPSVLIARGLFFDRVGIRTITLKRADFLDRSLTSPVFSMASRCKVDRDPIPAYPRIATPVSGTADRVRAYQKTWTAGKPSSLYGDDLDFLAYQEEFLLRRAGSQKGDSALRDIDMLASTIQRGSESGNANRFATSAADVCDGRRFFITGGGMFGIGPGVLEQGDVICVLLGHDVPVILREKVGGHVENGHVLLGDCYVHGIMCGETIRAWGGPDGDLRDVKLC
ncbi:HET-domain-containing protein, partial [Podospora aff. communis PSN243]